MRVIAEPISDFVFLAFSYSGFVCAQPIAQTCLSSVLAYSVQQLYHPPLSLVIQSGKHARGTADANGGLQALGAEVKTVRIGQRRQRLGRRE